MIYKKIFTLFLALFLLAGSFGVYAQDNSRDNQVKTLAALGIMSGDPDGNLRLEDSVTRAEFTKVAITASSYKNSVAPQLTMSPFKDVPYTHWAAPYIKLAVTNKIVQGYPDSTFGPDNPVLFEEAVTIALKLLGYTDADFGISWPYGQVGKAKNIGLTDNMTSGVGDYLTRGEVMTLTYNLLMTKTKSGSSSQSSSNSQTSSSSQTGSSQTSGSSQSSGSSGGNGSTYIDTLGYKLVEDVILIASSKEDVGVGGGKVYTSSGTYKIDSDFNYNDIGKKGTLILENTDEVLLFCPNNQSVEEYLVYSTKSNVIMARINGLIQEFELDDTATIYNKSQKTTMKDVKASVKPGSSISLYRNADGTLEYGMLREKALDQSMVVYSADWLSVIGMDNSAIVYRDGQQATLNDVAVNDTIYYSKRLNTIWVYSSKNSSYYTDIMGYEIVEDVTLIASANEYSSIPSDRIFTAGGTSYKIKEGFDLSNIGRKGDLILNDSDEVVAFTPSDQIVEDYIIYSTLAGNILVLKDGVVQPISLDGATTIYYKTTSSAFSTYVTIMQPGDTISLFRNDYGDVEYGLWRTNTLVGPITVKAGGLQSIFRGDLSNLTVIRDGKKVTSSEVAVNDIIYYSEKLNMVWAYSNKKTGIYEKASPNKDMPTSVTISGVSYDLESTAAFNAFGAGGTFEYGDAVTILLGRSGKIADAIPADATNASVFGYVTETGKKEYTNAQGNAYSSYYIKLVSPDGNEYEYVTDKDYASYKNRIMKVTFTDGLAKATTLNSNNNLYGKVDASRYTIGSTKISPDIKIMDVGTVDLAKASNYVLPFLQRIDGVNLGSSDVLYYEKNSSGEISSLILNDVTGDCYKYGLMLGVGGGTSNKSYTYDIKGVTTTTSENASFYVFTGQGTKFTMNGTKVDFMSQMYKVSNVADLTNTYVLGNNGTKYPLASDVAVYRRTTDYKYFYIPLTDALTGDYSSADAYYDKDASLGGRVRVIVVME